MTRSGLRAVFGAAFAGIASLVSGGSSERLSLPFRGRWFVMQGGDTPNVNQHMSVRAQWFGVDFARVDGPSGRALSPGEPRRSEDFYSWNEPVLSPAEGTIVALDDRQPDNPLGVKDPIHPAGNHVVIQTAPDRFVFVAHLRSGSVEVAAGRKVRRGDRLGRCGNSGNSDFPHIHVHVQDSRTLDEGNGINPLFEHADVELTGKIFADVTWPMIRGLFVSPH